jgi:DNA polymerase III subunit delta
MVTTLTGSNSFLLQSELSARVQAFLREHGDMALERLDGEETTYDRMREAIESMPFLASKKLVVLRAPSSNKEFVEKAPQLLEGVTDTTDVLIYEPKLDKRTAYAKYLQKKTDFTEYKELDAPALARWLVDEAKQAGASLSQADAMFLVNRLGPQQQLLATEVHKLASASNKIDKTLITSLTEPVPQSSTFDLLEAAFTSDFKRTLILYEEQRKQNVEPQAIVGLLGWQLHVLAVCAWAGDNLSPQDVAKDAKLHPFVVQKSMSLARRIGKPQLRTHIERLTKLDEELKTSAVRADDAVQAYLLSLG